MKNTLLVIVGAIFAVLAFFCICIFGFSIVQKVTPITNIGDWFVLVSALGEFIIAFVIYWEWEGNRLDQFLADAGSENVKRKEIFKAYCGLELREGTPRNQMFKNILGSAERHELKDLCDENIRLFSRVGARLPIFPPLRNRALDWHVVVFLWEILGPYVEERRVAAGPSFAAPFLEYAFASVERLLRQKRNSWEIIDPDVIRNRNVTITREHLERMRDKLRRSLASRSAMEL
jgi:hypothetical protein